MSVLKTTSAKEIIAYTNMKFHPTNSEWIGDAVEFIGIGLGLIGHIGGVETVPYLVTVTNNRVNIPCATESLLGIEEFIEGAARGNKIPPLDSYRGIKGDKTTSEQYPLKWYYLNGGRIHFSQSLEGKQVILWCQDLILDEEGWPQVPDTPEHKEALAWFILTSLLGRGHAHPVFDWKTANYNWEIWWARASNSAKKMNLDDMDRFKDNMTQWANDFRRNKRFNNASIFGLERAVDYTKPSDLGRTIIHIEPTE